MAARQREEHLHAHEIKEEAIFPSANLWDSSFSFSFFPYPGYMFVLSFLCSLVFDSTLWSSNSNSVFDLECNANRSEWQQYPVIRVYDKTRRCLFFHLINACRIKWWTVWPARTSMHAVTRPLWMNWTRTECISNKENDI